MTFFISWSTSNNCPLPLNFIKLTKEECNFWYRVTSFEHFFGWAVPLRRRSSVSQLLGRKTILSVSRSVQSKTTTSTTKNVIRNVFLMQDFYFEMCGKAVGRCPIEWALAVPIRYLHLDEMLWGWMLPSLIDCYLSLTYYKLKVTSENKLSFPVGRYAVLYFSKQTTYGIMYPKGGSWLDDHGKMWVP